jgi:hypothetical protein
MTKDRTRCAYCGNPATTVDHIPPECLYTPPRPSNLVTVPACSSCNNGASDDDEVFRNEFSIMAGSFGESANAGERLKTSLRGIRRNKAMLRRMVLGSQEVERVSQGGIYLGKGYAVPVQKDVHRRVIGRIIRGLYWHHFDSSVGLSTPVTQVYIDKTKPHWLEGLEALRPLNLRHVMIGDGQTFQYLYGQSVDDPLYTIWLIIFFAGSAEQIYLCISGVDDRAALTRNLP